MNSARAGVAEGAALRIGLYSPELPESGVSNGIITYTGIMRDALRSLGHEVMIVTAKQIEHFDGRVAELPKAGPLVGRVRSLLESFHGDDGLEPWLRVRILEAFAAARRAGVDVFEIEESFGWAGRLTGRGVPIVERLHGPHCLLRDMVESDEQRRRSDLRERAEFAAFSKVQAVTAPTQRMLDVLARDHGLDATITRAIPNPMPVGPAENAWSVERADPDQILAVGRFDLLKGADVALRAFALALEERPSLKLVMAGPDPGLANPNGPPTHFEHFVASGLSPEARAQVQFLGAQPPQRIAELRAESAFALVTSRFENFPYSIAEAMAVGMPVLSSDTFGGGEMIRSGMDGMLVPVDDVEGTAAAILQMLASKDRLGAMGQSARTRVAEWLAPDRIAAETVSIYREVLAAT